MDKFFLEVPSANRKQEIIDYLDEFKKYNSEINGTGGLDKIYEGLTFEEALDMTLKMQDEEYAKETSKCPSKTFLLIRESDNKIIGSINIRWNLTEAMEEWGGNIGYSIRPTERKKGFNKINLYLGLLESQKLGLKKVMLDCDASNIGSYKTMEALGGILSKEAIDPNDGMLTRVYWFDVDDSLKKYKPLYEDSIIT